MILGKTDNGKEFKLPIDAHKRESNREYQRRYRAAHPELKAKKHAYYLSNRDKWPTRKTAAQNARRRELWAANSAAINAARRELRRINGDSVRAVEKAWRARNAEKKRASDRRFRLLHPEKFKASVANARAAKPELYRQIAVKRASARRSRVRGSVVEAVSISGLIARDSNICHLCRRRVGRKSLTLDHIIPVIRNGAFAEWNLAIAHLRCNQRRGTQAIINPETREAAERYIASRGISQP